ncbi:MAG TPA: glycosyltransferase family 4 protein [Actinomycetota bacterium]|nr:glycosyltransferase family 4 protein [Actinomycetota bacterium]
MRIAIVCPYAWDLVGGVQTHIRALARTLRARDHDVQIIAPVSGRGDGVSSGFAAAGRAVGIPANGSVAPVAFGPGAAIGVKRALDEFGPDVVHLHEPLIPSVSLHALWRSDAPLVGTFHASADSSLGYRVARPVLDRAARRLRVRTAVSDAARALASRYFPGEYALTPNGIQTELFTDAEPLDLGAGPRVLFFGRIERRKGLEVLVQAMTRLRDLNATLVVAGSGPEERHCRKLAAQLGVPAEFIGRLDEGDVPRAYRAADVYCAPGLGGESFGIVLVEAMAAGTPVVCSDLTGFRAVAGGAAELVPPGEPGPLADALRVVLTDGERAARMSRAGRRLASMYDWSRLVAGVESIYERARSPR